MNFKIRDESKNAIVQRRDDEATGDGTGGAQESSIKKKTL